MDNADHIIKQPRMEPGKLLELMSPKPLPWERFEDEVAAHIKREIAEYSLGLQETHCKVYQRKPYYSKTRESDIVFDVAIEVLPTPDAPTPLLIWVWECKDYPARTVSVDEVEEFAEKLRQVGAHKGTIATRKGFQSGAETVAKSYRIGLTVLNKERHCIVQFSQDAGIQFIVNLTSPMAIDCAGKRLEDESVFLEAIIDRELHDIETAT